jgi:uncharacterized membrane protein YoaK (UPF0700 family)
MNEVPGVIQFESNTSLVSTTPPDFCSAANFASSRSLADANLRLRCWLSFARGATPSIAMNNTLVGFAILCMLCVCVAYMMVDGDRLKQSVWMRRGRGPPNT